MRKYMLFILLLFFNPALISVSSENNIAQATHLFSLLQQWEKEHCDAVRSAKEFDKRTIYLRGSIHGITFLGISISSFLFINALIGEDQKAKRITAKLASIGLAVIFSNKLSSSICNSLLDLPKFRDYISREDNITLEYHRKQRCNIAANIYDYIIKNKVSPEALDSMRRVAVTWRQQEFLWGLASQFRQHQYGNEMKKKEKR